MLSLFPTLLAWQQLSPLLIRIVLGIVLIHWSYRRLKYKEGAKSKVIGIIDAILGGLLVIGLWTQLAAILLAIDLVIRIIEKVMKKQFMTDGVNYYLILLVLAISLMVTGAGWLARDLGL